MRISEADGSANLFEEPGGKKENWKKTNIDKKSKIHYKTLDEVIADNESKRFAEFSTQKGIGKVGKAFSFSAYRFALKVIDMTGPEQKVYDDFSSFSRRAM